MKIGLSGVWIEDLYRQFDERFRHVKVNSSIQGALIWYELFHIGVKFIVVLLIVVVH